MKILFLCIVYFNEIVGNNSLPLSNRPNRLCYKVSGLFPSKY